MRSWGWAALDLATGRRASQNADLRLPMCSSFKWLLAAAILSRADTGQEDLRREIAFGPRDIVFKQPDRRGCGESAEGPARLSVERLCEATVTLSDSAAATSCSAPLAAPLD